jgi:hypothetical protein
MMLRLSRDQILAFRRRVGQLDERQAAGARSLRRAAWAGLQDSMPRAALLSLNARLDGVGPASWEDPALAQVWGPRFSAYVVPRSDIPIFTLARLPEGPGRRRAVDIAERLDAFLAGRPLDAVEAGRGLGIHPNALRYAAPTGRVLIRWDGARQPMVWTIPAPEMEPIEARLELARRYLHVFGPATPQGFGRWAGIKPPAVAAAFEGIRPTLMPVRTPVGEGWILAADEDNVRAPAEAAAPARLLPSGDTFFLLWDADREVLVPDAARRGELWTSRVWPGALLVSGDIAGTWRRAGAVVEIQSWRALTRAERDAIEAEATRLPLPGITAPIVVHWAS